MKQYTYILFLLLLPTLTTAFAPPDTIKSGAETAKLSPVIHELRQALVDLRIAEKEKTPELLLEANLHIGLLYEREHFFKKAIEYLAKAEAIANMAGNEAQLIDIQTHKASLFLLNDQPEAAHEGFLKLYEKHQQTGNYELQVRVLQQLAGACLAMQNFSKAKDYYLTINAMAQARGDLQAQATAWNNYGFAANQTGQFEEAAGAFQQAEVYAAANKAAVPDYIYTNLAIALNNQGQVARSVEKLKRADENKDGSQEKSYIRHLISSIYLKNNDVYNALRYNESAISAASESANAQVLCDAYDAASQIYQQLFEYDKALDFYKKHLALKDSLLRTERQAQLELETLHNLLERTENETLQGFADEELRQLTLEQLLSETRRLQLETENQQLEADRQEKELALLFREQEVEDANLRAARLETERSQQALRLATQQLLAEQQRQEIAGLNQQRQLDSLEAARQQAEQQRQIAGLENEQRLNEMQLQQQEEFRKNAYRLGGLLAVVLFVIFGSWLYGRRLNRRLAAQNRKIETQKQEIEAERSRAEGLLLNILPGEVAEELKSKGAATPRHYTSVSVLFTDFQGFTKIASAMPPAALVEELNEFFLAFDEICEQHGLEKIKTIGDSFMCAGGLPVENSTHPQDAVRAALEMLAFIHKKNLKNTALGKPEWPVRIGIHTGEVVSGVVGSKKFAYDIWGDTVNVASRMESNCPVGNVNISEATYRLLNQSFVCEYRGEVEVKNKGRMGMYLVKE